MTFSNTNHAPLVFAPEPDDAQKINRASWRILVVDDDEEVHKVTKLALTNQVLLDRTLTFEHAYNSHEARRILTEHDDFAVILLDVVMETDSAGLDLVHYIREQLDMCAPRIILRTGQPGYAPEQDVIHNYDINDYRSKTEMTQGRLITSVTTAIRSYRQINLLDQSLQGLELAIRKASSAPNNKGLVTFAQYALEQLETLLGLHFEGIFAAQIDGQQKILAATGSQSQFKTVTELPEQQQELVKDGLYSSDVCQSGHCICLNINNSSLPSAVCLKMPEERVDKADLQLLKSYVKHLRVAYQNIILMQKLHHTAYVDEITQLPNRTKTIQILDQLTAEHKTNMCAALIDIEHFSDINGSLGQSFGDDTLRAVASVLTKKFGDGTVQCTRVNSDVFAVIGPEPHITPEILLSLFEKPLEVNSNQIPLRIKIGLCRIAPFHQDGLGIIHQCSLALKQAKRNQHLYHTWFEADYETRTRERLSIIRRLRQAFNQELLELWYQPQVNLETGKIEALEALIRWRDGEQFISPAVFIPLAEYSGLIVEIGSMVLDQACQQLAELKKMGQECRIAVNVSMQQFRSNNFVELVKNTLEKYQVEADKLELEITESVVMDDPESVVKALNALNQMGVKVAIDDFGTGYSSLSYLRQLPLSTIKIDRAFVCEINQPEACSIVEMVVGLASRLELLIIAEGIETTQQASRLHELGCHLGQGYLMARPMPIEQAKLFLQNPPENLFLD